MNRSTFITGFYVVCAAICMIIAMSTFLYSGSLVLQHWWGAMTPCVECSKTFWQHLLVFNHILPLALLAWSATGLVRAGLFCMREYRFQSALCITSSNSRVQLVTDATMAAWSGGLMHAQIYVDTDFWKQLTGTEKKALLAHEQYHVDHHEVLQFFVLGLCNALIVLPLHCSGIAMFIRTKRMQSELAADRSAMQATSKKTLASLLHKALSFEALPQTLSVPALQSFLSQRVSQIVSHTTVLPSQLLQSSLFSITLLSVALLLVYALSIAEPLQHCLS